MRFLRAELAALAAATAYGLKVGVIADLHTNPNYNSTIAAKYDCVQQSGATTDVAAPLCRYGCDSSTALIDVMLQHFRDTFGKPDVLLVVGDHVAHCIDDYDPKMATIAITSQLVNTHFADTPVLFQVGNNDTKDHDQAPSSVDRTTYYTALWSEWFEKMAGNAALAKDTSIKNTFMQGGFYRYDLSSTVAVLVLDSMYYLIDNDQTPEGSVPQGQFDWLKSQLELAKGTATKFIIAFHVYAGARYKYND